MKLINHRPKIAAKLLKWCAWAAFISLTTCQYRESEATNLSPSSAVSFSSAVFLSSAVSRSTEKTTQGTKLVDNFEKQGGVNLLGGFWYTAKDSGGESQVSPPPGKFKVSAGGANGSSKSARITGKVAKNGYIALGTSLDKTGKSVDLSQYKGIEFWVKGDGKEYGFQLQTPAAIKDNNYYNYVFVAKPEWTRQVIRFDQLKTNSGKKNVAIPLQKALKQVKALTWYTYPFGQPRKSVDLSIDDVKLIQ